MCPQHIWTMELARLKRQSRPQAIATNCRAPIPCCSPGFTSEMARDAQVVCISLEKKARSCHGSHRSQGGAEFPTGGKRHFP